MKKIVAVLMALCLCVALVALTGCSNKTAAPAATEAPAAATEAPAAEETTEAAAEETTEAAAEETAETAEADASVEG